MTEQDQDPVVIRLRRSHAVGLLGLLVGLAVGILLGSTVFDGDGETRRSSSRRAL